jgi:nucleotide-binding universal stress UspA family protein
VFDEVKEVVMAQDKQVSGTRRIVAGVDGSPSSIEALKWALRQAELTGATVEAVIAWHFPVMMGGYAWPPVGVLETTDFAGLAAKVLAEAVTSAIGADDRWPVKEIVQEGDAARILIEQAEGADLLVVGSRGHGGFTEALLGSVSQHCVHHARCPVVIIRGTAPA